MEKKNPNIYQRALDIVNHRINPDIPQGGGEYALKEDLDSLDGRVAYLEEHGGDFDINSLTREDNLYVGDTFAFYDNSAHAMRKIPWGMMIGEYAKKTDLDSLDERVEELEQHGGGGSAPTVADEILVYASGATVTDEMLII